MIYPLVGLLIGALIGGVSARRQKGNRADILQWAAVGAMLFGLIGLFLLIFLDRSMR